MLRAPCSVHKFTVLATIILRKQLKLLLFEISLSFFWLNNFCFSLCLTLPNTSPLWRAVDYRHLYRKEKELCFQNCCSTSITFLQSCCLAGVKEIFIHKTEEVLLCYLQWTSRVTVSKSGISVAEFDASHLYRASLSVTFTNMATSADTDLSFTLVTELICRHKQPTFN